MRTYKRPVCKSFRMRTYKNQGGGAVHFARAKSKTASWKLQPTQVLPPAAPSPASSWLPATTIQTFLRPSTTLDNFVVQFPLEEIGIVNVRDLQFPPARRSQW